MKTQRAKRTRDVDEEEENRVRPNVSGTIEGAVNNATESEKLTELDIDIKLPAVDENKDMEPIEDNIHPLDKARKKYFFSDGSTPSFRLLENVDDCGNEIEEPDLWRPVGMDSKAYEAKIERAKKASTAGEADPLQEEHGLQTEGQYQVEQSIQLTQSYMSVQCAQKYASTIQIPKSMNTVTRIKEGDSTIDPILNLIHHTSISICFFKTTKVKCVPSFFSRSSANCPSIFFQHNNCGKPNRQVLIFSFLVHTIIKQTSPVATRGTETTWDHV